MNSTPLLVLLAVLAPLAAAAEGPTPESCAQINDDAARLACYDGLAHRAPAAAAQPAAPVQPAAPAQPAAPEQPAAPAATPEARFGAETLNQPPPGTEPPKDVSKIEAHIAGPMNGWKPGTIFTLTNGQEWKVTGDDSAYYPDPVDGPAVVIRRGFFTGSYFMEIAGTGRKVKVRRVR
jgi:hypothetical protein